MTRHERVAVTGFGVISGIGVGGKAFAEALREGRCVARPPTYFDASGFPHGKVCEAADFDPLPVLQMTTASAFGRVALLGAAAARMAVEDARLDPDYLSTLSALLAVGTTDGEALELDALAAAEAAGGLTGPPPEAAGRACTGRLALAAVRELGLRQVEAVTLPAACAAGNYAIGTGLDALRAGEADMAVCIGADTVGRRTFAGFFRIGALAPDCCRPFDRDRQGLVFGEGAGAMVLEPLERAMSRGAVIHAEVAGFALNCDATHATRPDEESVAECIRGALDDARVHPGEVDLVFAHGTGTKRNDPTEAAALVRVFGPGSVPPTTALKSMLGHTLGAAAMHAGIAGILAMDGGFLPPTANHRVTDPLCPIDCVPNHARPAEVRTVLVNALGMGGYNAAVVLRRPPLTQGEQR